MSEEENKAEEEEEARGGRMSELLKDSIRLYFDRTWNPPYTTLAVFKDKRFRFTGKKGENGFLFGVAFYLSSKPRANVHAGQGEFVFSFTPGEHPRPVAFPQLPKFDSEAWIEAESPAEMRNSIFLLLTQTKEWSGLKSSVDVDLESGIDRMTHKFRLMEKKRAFLRWLMTWQLPRWDAANTSNSEAFSEIQEMAKGYGVTPWHSESTFNDVIGELRRG